MLSSFCIYLAEASVTLAAFALLYQLLLRRLTHFQWNRGYLLGSVLLSAITPLLPLPISLSENGWNGSQTADAFWLNLKGLQETATATGNTALQDGPATITWLSLSFILLIIMGVYLLGCLYKSWRLFRNLMLVYQLIRRNEPIKKSHYTLLYSQEVLAPFSFLHYIFLHKSSGTLSEEELAQVLEHEQVHVAQKHTLDLLLYEVATILFWFNPAVYYLSRQVREVHEYQVDQAVIQSRGNTRAYGTLLLKLATQQGSSPIMNTFSSKQIINRITMLTQPKSSAMQKFRFIFALPVLALSLVFCSFLSSNNYRSIPKKIEPDGILPVSPQKAVPILKISWKGNKAYSDAQLNQLLGLSPGDTYNKDVLNSRLGYNPEGNDVASLYMDNGYLFFSVNPKEVFVKNGVELEFIVDEGPQMRFGNVIIKGNNKVATADILKKIGFKTGELFDRSKVIQAQKDIIQMGHFNPEKIGLQPIPNIEAGTVDWEFTVEEQ